MLSFIIGGRLLQSRTRFVCHCGAHSSMLFRNGTHMSTHAASIRFRCRLLNWLRKNSSSVSFLRSLPNHNGSAVSRLHTTVRNLPFLPRYNSSAPICRKGGFRRPASHRSKYRRSIARTVLAAKPIRRATCRADALSQACPTASSNRLLYGALLGNWATFSARNPQRGHFIRYVSTTTVVEYSKQGRSRTSRWHTSWIGSAPTCCPHPEQISFNPVFFRLTHSFRCLPCSSISM